jgi:Trypsin
MRRVVLVLATIALAILLAGGVAQAIINGEPDRGPNAHSYVGAYVAKVEGGKLRPVCSGTLISPKVFLTAGHCTQFDVERNLPVYVSFDPTYKPGASQLIKGTPYLHPKARIVKPSTRAVRYDVGVVVLKKPVRMATYGTLPHAGRDPQAGQTPHHRGLRHDRIQNRRGAATAAAAGPSGRPLQCNG